MCNSFTMDLRLFVVVEAWCRVSMVDTPLPSSLYYVTDVSTTIHPHVVQTNTVEPLYKGHFGTLIPVQVSSIQRSLITLQYYTGTQNGVLIIEVFAFQKFVIGSSVCIFTPSVFLCCTDVTVMFFSVVQMSL